ncbi:peptide transporter ptr2 [Myotisia sp. PD_48]|nr:peptide transporter ptr2 [Myotisia sp. PD_48]
MSIREKPELECSPENHKQPHAGCDSSSSEKPRDATEEEIETLPRVADRVPLAAWIVIFAGSAERFTYYGVIAPWQNYVQNPRGNHAVPGALGLGQSTAVSISNALYLCGCVLIVTTSLPVALDQGAGLGGFIASMIFIGLGVGAVKATLFPILGDQYIQRKPQVVRNKNGEIVLIDGKITLQLLYNVYYWFTNVASLSSIPTTFIEKEFDFWAAYLLTAAALCISIILFVFWSGKLVRIPPQGTVLPKATKVVWCAARSGFKLERAKSSYQQAHHGRTVPWSDHFVDDMKRGVLACRVIFSFLVFYLCINQMYNNLVAQAGQMNLHGVPNDMIQAIAGVACIICGPIIQWLYSSLAKRRLTFGPMARITTAFLLCGAGMAYAAGIQQLIYSTGPCYDRPLACSASGDGRLPNDVNVWLQVPLYFLLAVAEIFGFVTAFEYAYSKSPAGMKTIIQALTQLVACLASALGMAISPAARDPHMVIMYSCLAAGMGLTAVLFLWRFRKYDAIDEALNRMDIHEGSGLKDLQEDRTSP